MNRHTPLSILALAALLISGLSVVVADGPGDRGPEPRPASRAYLHSYNLPSSGVALEGYCPVAYFAVGKAVRGTPAHASTWQGVTYHFVSAEAKAAFDRDPARYLPAFGGWCAFGMAVKDKFPVDPTSFRIADGRLLLFLRNRDVDAAALWDAGDEAELLARADAHWRTVRGDG